MIIHPHQSEHFDALGGKAKALALLTGVGCEIPPWFAVTDFDDSLRDEITRCAGKLGSNRFAVRSSARGEDGVEHSFAGQYDTFLYVELPDLFEKIRKVQESNQSAHLKTYQSSRQIALAHRPIALIQAMLTPDVSGVAFSADPVTGKRDHAIVSGLWGTGSAIVSGEADADTWSVDKDYQILDRNIARKTHQHTADPLTEEGVKRTEVAVEKQDIPCLNDAQVIAVANLARMCADHFGCPQDIEWAMEGGKLYLLQSRPITTLAHIPDPDAPLTVWDNSNIAESYSGITSPMTFSFAERAYEHVYREFCKLLSVPRQRIMDNDDVFPQMLGHIHGHVYYNLNSWYHVLAMLPGFSVNRSFMEQMMGVKEPMPDEVVQAILKKTRTSKVKDCWALVRTCLGLIRNHRSLQKQIDAFYLRLNTALGSPGKALTGMRGEELTAHYQELESQLLKRWDAPLINDFFAMIFYGLLKSLCEKWLGDASLQNTLLLDAGDIISAEPPRRIKAMAELVASHDELTRLLADPECEPDKKLTALRGYESIHQLYENYLTDFGDRCLEELKLESPTVSDNPQSLLTGIGVMAVRINKGQSTTAPDPVPADDPTKKLSGVKRRLFPWVLENAKNRVRDRENLRFERTRLFGRVRQIIVELGKRLHHDNRLDAPEDVFFLTITEVMNAYPVAEESINYLSICHERRHQQSTFKTPPPDRFETRGPLDLYPFFTPTTSDEPHDGEQLHGTGACPGIVRGPVRVVTDPRNATLQEGEILVAQQTDPGWVVLFPAASGLLVERGSLLSHSAIVARELQLPCIVSIRSVTTLLKTGDLVEMNGSTGEIKILDASGEK
ncbi:MAG: phosphoenolpyruvate synthase [Akkermansiaceae bacterium]|nr:phosphoenolpyruvate synthase [Akkermansiaceae bacterium]